MSAPLLQPIIFSGHGLSLYPLCDTASSDPLPKALLPLANRPLVAFALQSLLSAGLRTALLVAPHKEHAAITRALQSVRLTASSAVGHAGGEKSKHGKSAGTAAAGGAAAASSEPPVSGHIQVVDGLTSVARPSLDREASSVLFRLELLPLGPFDRPTASESPDESSQPDFRQTPSPGTAELLRWIATLGKLDSADPLIVPVDLLAPSAPIVEVVQAHLAAAASEEGAPALTCLIYERGTGEGTGKEREKEGPAKLLTAYSVPTFASTLGQHLSSSSASSSSRSNTSHRLLLLKEADEIEDSLTLRRSLFTVSPHSRLSTSLLDAHVYILRRDIVVPLLGARRELTSLREHVVPLLAKAGWQPALREELLGAVLQRPSGAETPALKTPAIEREAELALPSLATNTDAGSEALRIASLARSSTLLDERKRLLDGRSSGAAQAPSLQIRCVAVVVRLKNEQEGAVTEMEEQRFVARANTVPTYLECNRWLLRALSSGTSKSFTLPSLTSNTPAETSSAQLSPDTIVGEASKVGERAALKRCVIGARCEIGRGARLTGCVLMEGCKVGDNARLENVIMCPRATVGERSTLKDCDVASGVNVLPETQAKMEKITGSAEGESDEEN